SENDGNTICKNGNSTSSACSGACAASFRETNGRPIISLKPSWSTGTCVNSGARNTAEGNIMGRTDQHHTCECRRAVEERCEGQGGDPAGINVTRMWRNQCFRGCFQGCSGIGE